MESHVSTTMPSTEGIPMTFLQSAQTPLFISSWTPITNAQYAATCLFLVVLCGFMRFLLSIKPIVAAHLWPL
ncbi:hypothetical protein S7711_01303 [Stachybotrys chartarum IBT 7711]|uniref:Copper transport protein n=1 Tax=Stachybotrys chartarum (strain CBS 109288 / IBT 7711) TaxID=1280523 RepID=A0A084BBM5_STACB|nr:hypothetical protein S7711_01303 [Stachybotrys chartarum IBT 7711]KFA79322.1 hypothetical protein S40288_03575 [Stachybotrys chartarum IBT 40288]